MQELDTQFSFLKDIELDSKYVSELSSMYSTNESINHLFNTLSVFFKNHPISQKKNSAFNEDSISDNLQSDTCPNHNSYDGKMLKLKNEQLFYSVQTQLKEIELIKSLFKEKEIQLSKASKLVSSLESENLNLSLEVLSVKSKLRVKENSFQLQNEQVEFLKQQVTEQNLLNEAHRREKATQFELLQEETNKTKFELSLVLSQNKKLKDNNKKISKDNQEILSSKERITDILEKKITSLQSELTEQKKIVEISKKIVQGTESESIKLREKISLIEKDYQSMCTGIEEFERKTQDQHGQLLQEIEILKLEHNRN